MRLWALEPRYKTRDHILCWGSKDQRRLRSFNFSELDVDENRLELVSGHVFVRFFKIGSVLTIGSGSKNVAFEWKITGFSKPSWPQGMAGLYPIVPIVLFTCVGNHFIHVSRRQIEL
jgi:hypothetical protein